MQQADLSGANLEQASLTESQLQGANLFGANLIGTNLLEAKYARDTKWPKHFAPKAAGAIEFEWSDELQDWVPVDED